MRKMSRYEIFMYLCGQLAFNEEWIMKRFCEVFSHYARREGFMPEGAFHC